MTIEEHLENDHVFLQNYERSQALPQDSDQTLRTIEYLLYRQLRQNTVWIETVLDWHEEEKQRSVQREEMVDAHWLRQEAREEEHLRLRKEEQVHAEKIVQEARDFQRAELDRRIAADREMYLGQLGEMLHTGLNPVLQERRDYAQERD